MALNNEDLRQIEAVLKEVVPDIVKDIVKAEIAIAVKPLATQEDLDRMENRLIAGMKLLERDSFSRLDEHEARITKLEQAAAR